MGNLFSDIRNKIKVDAYNKERDSIIRKWVANIGRIVEEDDRIICYVQQDLLDKYRENKESSFLEINGINNVNNSYKEYLDGFNLNKPVYYIFDGVNFTSEFSLYSRRANIIFKHCIFEGNISIIRADEVTFEDNMYLEHYSRYIYSDCFLCGDNINKLKFLNENFVNSDRNAHPVKFGMKINADMIEIINTEIICPYPGDINIDANNMVIEDSSIETNELYLDCDSITYSDSYIKVSKMLSIDNKECSYIGNIQTPIIFYNGEKLIPVDGKIVNVGEAKELKKARIDLIVKLYQLNYFCQLMKENRIKNARNILEEQPVGSISRTGNERDNYNQLLLNQERIKLIKMLSDIKDYYLAKNEEKIEDIKDKFDKQSIIRVLKRDDLGF